MWQDDCNDLIKSCGKLSSLLGTPKSFSTSDITQLFSSKECSRNEHSNQSMRHAVSDIALNSFALNSGYMLESTRLSRSCSTWVAVGELASTSQLPSPHGYCSSSSTILQLNASNINGQLHPTSSTPFTATDLIQSVNKKIRESYVRSRLVTAHRAIERLSQSEFNLDQLATLATTSIPTLDGPGPTELIVPTVPPINTQKEITTNIDKSSKPTNTVAFSEFKEETDTNTDLTTAEVSSNSSKQKCKHRIIAHNASRSLQEIEKSRGRALSKYDRNMMIFNWLHSLDESSTPEDNN